MFNTIRQKMEQVNKLLTPFECLRNFERKGVELTQSEKIEVVEESAVNWTWLLMEDMPKEVLRLVTSMINKTDIAFAFPEARIKHIVSETIRRYEKAKSS